jgi:hypothetical protein
VVPAASSSTISDMWVAPSMTRCTLLVDGSGHVVLPRRPGGITAAAGCWDDQRLVGEVTPRCRLVHRGSPWTYSSIVLRTWLTVDKVQLGDDQSVSRQPLEDLRAAEVEIRPIGTELISPSDPGHGGDHFAAD